MSWVETFVNALWRIVPVSALVLAYLSTAPRHFGLSSALVVLVGLLVAVDVVMLYLLKLDLDAKFEETEQTVGNFRFGMEATLADVLDAIERVYPEADGVPESDGGTTGRDPVSGHENLVTGGRIANETMDRGRQVDVDGRDLSGAGALGGVVAGGVLGAPFGPPAVLVAGILGGLIGNAAEYRDLQVKNRERLQRAARRVIETQAPSRPRLDKFVEQRDGRDDRGEFWAFDFIDDRGVRHVAKLYLDDGWLEYAGSETDGQFVNAEATDE